MRAPLDGGPATQLGTAYNSVSVVLGDSGVYWDNSQPTDGGSISFVPISGGAATAVASNQIDPGWLAIDATRLYWTDPGSGTIWRAGLDGSAPLVLAVGQAVPIGIAVDDQYVYWVNIGSMNAATHWYDNHDGAVIKVAK